MGDMDWPTAVTLIGFFAMMGVLMILAYRAMR